MCPRRSCRTVVTALGMILVATCAQAQSADTLDSIVTQFQGKATAWESTLQALALNTFYILALIELAWSGCRLALRGADASEWIAELVNEIMFLGFFLALLQNAQTWGTAIVNSFRAAGQLAGGVGVAPSSIFAAGVNVAEKVLAQMSLWSPSSSVGLMIAAIVVLLCFSLMAAEMVITLVQSYICIAGGVLNMAFGGSRWTKDIAVSTLRYAISVGAKLMILQLLVSVGRSIIVGWADKFTDLTDETLVILIGCSIVMAAVVKTLPNEFQRIVGGASLATGSALVGAAAAVGGAAGTAALGAIGSVPMVGNAGHLASAQLSASDARAEASGAQAPQRSMMGRAAAIAGGTAKNIAGAARDDVGRRLAGTPGARHGLATWRMSAAMHDKRRLLSDDAKKPEPASSANTIS